MYMTFETREFTDSKQMNDWLNSQGEITIEAMTYNSSTWRYVVIISRR